jgi:hypothetical protein
MTTRGKITKQQITETDITVGGVIGVESFPIRKFIFGGEICLNYVIFGITDDIYVKWES